MQNSPTYKQLRMHPLQYDPIIQIPTPIDYFEATEKKNNDFLLIWPNVHLQICQILTSSFKIEPLLSPSFLP